MPSTYSSLKIQLMATGENNTTWGDVTNVNLGTAIEEAIVGSADVAFSNANVTLTLTDTNSTQSARNMRLNLTGTATAGYNLVVPAIEKPYIINNGTDGTITVKNSTGTGIAVPAGRTMWVYNNGTNVVDAVNYLSSLTLGSALSVASGGTGANTLTSGYLLKGNGTSAVSASIVYDSGSLVGVGAGTGAKTRLQVTAAAQLNAPVLGSATNAPLYVTNNDPAYGVLLGVNAADGHAWLQAQRTDGTATAANITLNEAGGNVGVGLTTPTSTFHVNGTVNFTGALTSGDLANAVGYKGLPQNQQTLAYTLAFSDMGKHIYATAGAFAITIPANSTTAFPLGTAMTIIVEDAGKTLVPAAGVTLVLAGTGGATTGTRTLAIGSVATLIKVGTNRWFVSGAGVT